MDIPPKQIRIRPVVSRRKLQCFRACRKFRRQTSCPLGAGVSGPEAAEPVVTPDVGALERASTVVRGVLRLVGDPDLEARVDAMDDEVRERKRRLQADLNAQDPAVRERRARAPHVHLARIESALGHDTE